MKRDGYPKVKHSFLTQNDQAYSGDGNHGWHLCAKKEMTTGHDLRCFLVYMYSTRYVMLVPQTPAAQYPFPHSVNLSYMAATKIQKYSQTGAIKSYHHRRHKLNEIRIQNPEPKRIILRVSHKNRYSQIKTRVKIKKRPSTQRLPSENK